MTPGGSRSSVGLGIILKLGIPLLFGLITIVSAHLSGVSGRDSIELGALVTVGLMLALFFIDFDFRLLALGKEISANFGRINRSTELIDLMNRSVVDTPLLTEFIEAAGNATGDVSPLLLGLARREIASVTSFVRQLPVGREIAYDGEDREWLLGLTEEAQQSIDAISLSTVDAGMRGFDGGLWTSDLGARYLELQREAIGRNVAIRRIFVFESADLAQDETFVKITQLQSEAGVDVRMLDHQLIPDSLRSTIFDFIIFDAAVTYETTPATILSADGTRPVIVRTVLAPITKRVRDLQNKFEQLWAAADFERQLGD